LRRRDFAIGVRIRIERLRTTPSASTRLQAPEAVREDEEPSASVDGGVTVGEPVSAATVPDFVVVVVVVSAAVVGVPVVSL
jgi:hypothetical protein